MCTEKNVYSAAFGSSILYINIYPIFSNVLFKASVYLFIFCLDSLSTDASGGIQVPYNHCVTVNFFFYFVSICFIYSDASM